MQIHNIEQGTPDWFELRKNRLTASHGTAIAANGSGLKTYIKKKVIGLFYKEESYTSADMERGNILEPIARSKYEFEKGVDVEQVGFISLNDSCGCSPDGLVGKDGCIEIKARNNEKHFDLLLTGKIDTGTVWQMQMTLLITGRKWCDFISYNPNFKNSLYVQRVERDEVALKKLEIGIAAGTKMFNEYLKNPIILNEIND